MILLFFLVASILNQRFFFLFLLDYRLSEFEFFIHFSDVLGTTRNSLTNFLSKF